MCFFMYIFVLKFCEKELSQSVIGDDDFIVSSPVTLGALDHVTLALTGSCTMYRL